MLGQSRLAPIIPQPPQHALTGLAHVLRLQPAAELRPQSPVAGVFACCVQLQHSCFEPLRFGLTNLLTQSGNMRSIAVRNPARQIGETSDHAAPAMRVAC